jgi:Type IV secretion-system coupling protein DNA-binding domain
MRSGDIRFNGQAATVKHHSARGRITRNSGNFTRGSQLLASQYKMTWAGLQVPIWIWLGTFIVLFNIFVWLGLAEHEFQLDLMKLYSAIWTWVGGDKFHLINLTLPNGIVTKVPIGYVPYEPHVVHAWAKTVKIFLTTLVMSAFIAAPIIMWFIMWANKRGSDMLQERHNRGALLVERDVLVKTVSGHNRRKFRTECAEHDPPYVPELVAKAPILDRIDRGIHVPYTIAGIPYPWRLEQSHTMLIGTTGTGKTTQLRSHVSQLRARGHRAVIFDLTGVFVETFYNP